MRVETVNIRPETFNNINKHDQRPCQNGTSNNNHTDTNRQQLPSSETIEKTDSVFLNSPTPNVVPAIHCEDYNMKEDKVILSDVGSDDIVDPSLNIEDTERKIQRSRRTSKMKSEAVTRQKLLRRIQSYEDKDQDSHGGQGTVLQSVEPEVSPTAADETIDASLKMNEVEERLVRTRRVSHSSYQQRLSLKKENLKKKTSLEEKKVQGDQAS